MVIYTLKEAARKAILPVETLKRACEEKLVKATRTTNRQWLIEESALEAAMRGGMDLKGLAKSKGKKGAQPEQLKRAQQARLKAAPKAA